MLLGPNIIYSCPKCLNFIRKGSLSSWNTIGAIQYSDGKTIAPMFHEFPNLIKCKKCDTILWLNEIEHIGICELGKECKPEWANADRAESLDIPDLFQCLELGDIKNDKEKELFVRQSIWWTFNDRIRKYVFYTYLLEGGFSEDYLEYTYCLTNRELSAISQLMKDGLFKEGKEIFIQESDEFLWKHNCQRLIELLDKENINQRIMTAELYRNLGEFDTCLELINSLPSPQWDYLKLNFERECKKVNTLVFPLNKNS